MRFIRIQFTMEQGRFWPIGATKFDQQGLLQSEYQIERPSHCSYRWRRTMLTQRPTYCPSSDKGVSFPSCCTFLIYSATCRAGRFPPWFTASVRLTGTKYGCGGGGCGACTVMVSRYQPTTKTIEYPLMMTWGSRSGRSLELELTQESEVQERLLYRNKHSPVNYCGQNGTPCSAKLTRLRNT